MENMLQNEQVSKPIFGKVGNMMDTAKSLIVNGVKGFSEVVMSALATKMSPENPQAARNAMSYLMNQASLNNKTALSGMRNRLLAYKNAPKGDESLN